VPAHFVVDPKTWAFCVRNVYRCKPTLLTGPTGCGKTELITHLAQATGRQVYAVNMGATTDPRAALIGTTHFRDGATTFAASRFLQGIQDPRGLVLLDEITRADDDANNILFPLLDGQRALSLDEAPPPRLIAVHPQVVFFATANIGQEYTGTRAFDRALHDRFCVVELDYPSMSAEASLLTARTHLPRKEVYKLVAFAHACRELWRRDELATPVSTRMLLEAAAAVHDGFSMLEALAYTVFPLFDASAGADADRAKVRQLLQRF
jgi:MoxR-like ATPase